MAKQIKQKSKIVRNANIRFYTSVVGIIIALLCFLAGMKFNAALNQHDAQQIALLQKQLAEKQKSLLAAEQQLNFSLVENEINQMAVRKTQQDLKILSEDKQNLQAQLTFYQRVMAPSLNQEALRIESFVVQSDNNGQYSYALALVKNPTHQGYLKGQVQVTLEWADGQTQSLTQPADEFNFKYFQILEKSFEMSLENQPTLVQIQVEVPRQGRLKKFVLEKSLDWKIGTLMLD